MEKETNKRSGLKVTSSSLRKKKVVGIEEEAASQLVGSIVEKGMPDKPFAPSAPKPSVIPFPVARHRAQGPHWAPLGSKMSKNEIEALDYDGGEENPANFDAIAAFANPIQRKEKKGLDFSRWRELVPLSDNGSYVPSKREDANLSRSKSIGQMKQSAKVGATSTVAEMFSESPLTSNMSGLKSGEDIQGDLTTDMELDYFNQYPSSQSGEAASYGDYKDQRTSMAMNGKPGLHRLSHDNATEVQVDKMHLSPPLMLEQQMPQASMGAAVSSRMSGNLGGYTTLESEIDAENHARLLRLSDDEIVEAQAEIMQKMDPALVEVLKRRGLEKWKKKKSASSALPVESEQCSSVKVDQHTLEARPSANVEDDVSHKITHARRKDSDRGVNSGAPKSPTSAPTSLWNTWSERVETVGSLRFYLDGTVAENDVNQTSENGQTSFYGSYSTHNVAERDFLRTEGDPAAAGYTIKEALALTRSVVPGQRALALHLVASVLDRALDNIRRSEVGSSVNNATIVNKSIDWEAVWAYALGPEPELVLSLRMSLDDNHSSVVLASAKVIQCMLSCDANENFFDTSEKLAIYKKDMYTAPVFRNRPVIESGFLRGGYWKYNAKRSNIIPFGEGFADEKSEGDHTIQDDIYVAGQDMVAGLVRMGILRRFCYLLETEPTQALDEWIISILVAVARHSPTCAHAVMKCQRLVRSVVKRFTMEDRMVINLSRIRSVTLLKVLARADKKNCEEFIRNGAFKEMTWHLYRPAVSINHWMKLGKGYCKLASALMVEQLRFWKVCIHYGHCVSDFMELFPVLCLWLHPPTFENLVANNLVDEFASIAMEAYLVLEALAQTLPKLYLQKNLDDDVTKNTNDLGLTWSWSHASAMIDLALQWIALTDSHYMCKFFDFRTGIKGDSVLCDKSGCKFLSTISAVLHMIATVLERVIPRDNTSGQVDSNKHLPWLPEFVPKIGLEIIKHCLLSSASAINTEFGGDYAGKGSFVQTLCSLRQERECEISLASVCCLHGLVKVVVLIDNLIQSAKAGIQNPAAQENNNSNSREGKILGDGIFNRYRGEFRCVLVTFMKLVASEWNFVQSIETFGRGGPAPGVGIGWGASGGGFWSNAVLLVQMDARMLVQLLELFPVVTSKDTSAVEVEEMTFAMQRITSALAACLSAGPRDMVVIEKALRFLLQVPVLEYLGICVRHFLRINRGIDTFPWKYEEEDYIAFTKVLSSHFKSRWLSIRRKSNEGRGSNSAQIKLKKGNHYLNTIPEDTDASNVEDQDHSSLTVEWAYQRLPLPLHWIVSPLSPNHDGKQNDIRSASCSSNFMQNPSDTLDVAKGGVFFLLGVEAISFLLSDGFSSPLNEVPLVWKLHSLSMILLDGMGVLEEEKSRDSYENLQHLYGQVLDQSRGSGGKKNIFEEEESLLPSSAKNYYGEFLRFQLEIHENYSTFLENLVEQFAAVSYGDLVFGRQVALYLHRCVEYPVRLAAWNALSNARVLELLPPLQKCIAEAEGYLEPLEDNEGVLEAYTKSWVSGALDKASSRRSITFTLAVHHLSCFIFGSSSSHKLLLRNKLAKILLRDYSRKREHEGMMLDFIQYKLPAIQNFEGSDLQLLHKSEIDKRLEILTESCEDNSSLLAEVAKQKVALSRKYDCIWG